MPVKFSDLSKKANDSLNKGFDATNSVKVTTQTANGVTYNAEVKGKGAGKVAGKVGAKYKHSNGFNLKKFEIANNGTLTSEIALTGAVDNATFNLNVAMQPLTCSADGEKCEIGFDYAHDKAQVTLKISPLVPTAAALSVLVQAHDNLLVGGSYSGQLDDGALVHSAGDVAIGYTTADSIATLTSGSFFNKFALNVFHNHSNDISFALNVGLDRANITNANVTVGGSYAVDADTSIKAKVSVPNASTDGASASFGFNQKLNSSVRLTAGTKIDLDPKDDLFGASFALGLSFGSV